MLNAEQATDMQNDKEVMIAAFRHILAKKAVAIVTAQMMVGTACRPERLLMTAIVTSAVYDCITQAPHSPDGLAAWHYLNGRLVHAELCGVDSVWVRRVSARFADKSWEQ